MGPFPYDRAVLAAAVRRSAELEAKGVVLKFFLNLSRSEEGDRALADAMTKAKVILQAGMAENDPGPNKLPDNFKLLLPVGGDTKSLLANWGGVPLPQLSARAYDIGFVDYHTIDRMPVIERYGDRYVKSLYTSCIELALNKTARVVPGESIHFGDSVLPLDERSQAAIRFPEKDDLKYISLVDFLDRKPRPEVKNRVVIVAFDGERFKPVRTPIGPVRPHRAFYYALVSLYDSVNPAAHSGRGSDPPQRSYQSRD